jgi:hypothetical protein
VRREAVKHQRISKPYEGLQPEEIDSYTGCSVCEQDQRTINVSPLKPFKVCRLIRGGHWSPDTAASIQADSEILHAMESMDLKWGGEILGKQKDFMHFSPTGY